MPNGLYSNHRGEQRWAQNVARALISGGHKVYIPHAAWPKNLDVPENLIVGGEKPNPEEAIFFTYDFNNKKLPFKLCIHNLWLPIKNITIPKNAIITQCYDVSGRSEQFKRQYNNSYHHLPYPAIEKTVHNNNFDSNLIVSICKVFFERAQFNVGSKKRIMRWLAFKMEENRKLEYHLCLGHDIENYEKRIWSYKWMKPLEKFKDRVIIYKGLPYSDVLKLLSRAKINILFMGDIQNYRGSPIEAASYGVPSIFSAEGPLEKASEILKVGSGDINRYINYLDKLYTDEKFYLDVSISYRVCVDENYTFETFRNKLYDILREKGVFYG